MAQDEVRRFMRTVRMVERFQKRAEDDKFEHRGVTAFARENGFVFTDAELKTEVKAMMDEDEDQLPQWVRDRVKDQYLAKWID